MVAEERYETNTKALVHVGNRKMLVVRCRHKHLYILRRGYRHTTCEKLHFCAKFVSLIAFTHCWHARAATPSATRIRSTPKRQKVTYLEQFLKLCCRPQTRFNLRA